MYNKRCDEQRDLNRGSNGHSKSEVHLFARCEDKPGDQLGSVSNNWQDDAADHRLGNWGMGDEVVYTRD